MAHRITSQPREATILPSHFNGEKPSPLFEGPLLEFHHFDPPEAPAYASSPRQVTLPGEDKAKAIGTQCLNKRAADEQPDVKIKKQLLIHSKNLMELADTYFKQRNYQSALKVYETILSKNDPTQIQMALYKKSKCSWMLGHLNDAKECLDHLLQTYPNDAQARARRGAILIQQHKYPEALADLKHSFVLSKTPPFFVEYTILFDCYDSFTNATDETVFHLQHVSYDSLGNPLVSEDDLHLLCGIFFASRQNYHSAIEKLSIAAQKPSNRLAIETLQVVQNISKRRGRITRQHTRSVTLQAKRVPISALLKNN